MFTNTGLCRLPVSWANLRQRVVKSYFPPPLDVTWRTQRSQNSAEQQSMSRTSSSWWFIISRSLESTRSTINQGMHNYHELFMNWFRRTCKESKTALYYWLHTMFIINFTGLLNIHNLLLFTLLCFSLKPAWFTGHENPPNECAKITRQKNPPVKSAVKTCQIYARL